MLPVEADQQPAGLGPALEVAGAVGVGLEPAGVLDGVVVQAGEPGGAGGGVPEVHVAVGLGEAQLGQPERLVARPDRLVVLGAAAGQVDQLLVVPGAVGVAGHGRQVGAVGAAQRLERGLVDAAALAAEQAALDRLPGEVVAEAEHVGVGLDEEPAADEPTQHRDELGLADAR